MLYGPKAAQNREEFGVIEIHRGAPSFSARSSADFVDDLGLHRASWQLYLETLPYVYSHVYLGQDPCEAYSFLAGIGSRTCQAIEFLCIDFTYLHAYGRTYDQRQRYDTYIGGVGWWKDVMNLLWDWGVCPWVFQVYNYCELNAEGFKLDGVPHEHRTCMARLQ